MKLNNCECCGVKTKNPRFCSRICTGKTFGVKFAKNHFGYWKNKKRPNFTGENHPLWKGDNVSYHSLHEWVYRHRGKPMICTFCGTREDLEWANRSRKYKREISDWLSLCFSCHRQYDSGENWGKAKQMFG